jgi:hypothetical protein
MKWFKENWGKILAFVVMLIGGADVSSGLLQGKSALNVANFPGGAAALASAGFLGFQWINRRTVQARTARKGLDEPTLEHLENIFGVAEHIDVTAEMVDDLAEMAAECVRRHADRHREARSAPVVIEPKNLTFPLEFAEIMNQLKKDKESV